MEGDLIAMVNGGRPHSHGQWEGDLIAMVALLPIDHGMLKTGREKRGEGGGRKRGEEERGRGKRREGNLIE